MTLYREATSDEIEKWLIEPLYVLPLKPDREAAARAHANNLGDMTMRDGTPFPDIYSEVDVILKAALGVGGETP